jgi:hypothetical protein
VRDASTLSARLELLHADILRSVEYFLLGEDRTQVRFLADRARLLIGHAATMEAENVRLAAENGRLRLAKAYSKQRRADALEDATPPVPSAPVHAVGDE